jgi:pilus assembly protein CpaE
MEMKQFPVTISVDNLDARRKIELLLLDRVQDVKILTNGDTPEGLVIQEVGAHVEHDLNRALKALHSGKVDEVFLTSGHSDPELFIKAMRMGIKEFLQIPIQEEEFSAALDRFFRRREQKSDGPVKRGRVIAVLGAKGGIGGTTLAVSLATALRRITGKEAVLVDMRQPSGDVPIFLDLEYTYTWGEITKEIERADSTLVRSVAAKHPSGLAVLPSPGLPEDEALDSPQAIHALFSLLREEYEYILVDANTSIDETLLKLLEISDDVLLLLTMNVPCLAAVKRFMDALRPMNPQYTNKIRYVSSCSMEKCDLDPDQAEEIIGKRIEWAIPVDYKGATQAMNLGKPLIDSSPRSPAAKAILKIAEEIAREGQKGEKKRRLFGFLSRKATAEA